MLLPPESETSSKHSVIMASGDEADVKTVQDEVPSETETNDDSENSCTQDEVDEVT